MEVGKKSLIPTKESRGISGKVVASCVGQHRDHRTSFLCIALHYLFTTLWCGSKFVGSWAQKWKEAEWLEFVSKAPIGGMLTSYDLVLYETWLACITLWLGFKKVVLEHDAKLVVDKINGKEDDLSRNAVILRDVFMYARWLVC